MLAAMSKAIGQAGINIAGVVLKKLPEGTGLASFEVLVSTRCSIISAPPRHPPVTALHLVHVYRHGSRSRAQSMIQPVGHTTPLGFLEAVRLCVRGGGGAKH